MPEFYNQAEDRPVVGSEWERDHRAPDSYPLATRPLSQTEVNVVTGHVLGCVCSKCPGWYVERAKAAAGQLAPEASPGAPARTPRPLTDQVVPVAILMVVFTMCMVVLLPVITPMVALGAVSLGLVAVSLCVVAVVGLAVLKVVRQTPRDDGLVRPRRTIIGTVLGRE